MKNPQELSFYLFTQLLPISVVHPLIEPDSLERMLKCKSLFDMAILNSHQEKLRGIYVDGIKID